MRATAGRRDSDPPGRAGRGGGGRIAQGLPAAAQGARGRADPAAKRLPVVQQRGHEGGGLLVALGAAGAAVDIRGEPDVAKLGQPFGLLALEVALAPPGVGDDDPRPSPDDADR